MPQVEIPQAEFKVVLLGDSNVGKSSLATRFAEGYYRESSRPPTLSAAFITKIISSSTSSLGIATKVQIWDTAGSNAYRAASTSFVEGGCDAVIVCYDISNRESLIGMKDRLNEILLLQQQRKRRRDREEAQADSGFGSTGRRHHQQHHHHHHHRGPGRGGGGMDIVVVIAGLKADLVSTANATHIEETNKNNNIIVVPSSPTRRSQRQRQSEIFVPDYEVDRLAETLGVLHFPTSAKTGQNVHELFTSIANKVLHSRSKGNNNNNHDDDDNEGGKDTGEDGEGGSSSPFHRDKLVFDKYYVANEPFSNDEKDDDSSGVVKDISAMTTENNNHNYYQVERTTPTNHKSLDNGALVGTTPASARRTSSDGGRRGGGGAREMTPESRKVNNNKKKKNESNHEYEGDSLQPSFESEDEDDDVRAKGDIGREKEDTGGSVAVLCNDSFTCQSIACGAGGDGTSCVVQ